MAGIYILLLWQLGGVGGGNKIKKILIRVDNHDTCGNIRRLSGRLRFA